jgi:hypothetical protein
MGQPGHIEQLAPPHPGTYKFAQKKSDALHYCDSNELIELTRVLMSKAATNNICSNKHKA